MINSDVTILTELGQGEAHEELMEKTRVKHAELMEELKLQLLYGVTDLGGF